MSSEPFTHPAFFYRDHIEYLAGTLPFVRAGLDGGEPVAVSVPGPQLALLREALGADAARVRLLDMTVEGRNPGRIIPGVLRAFADAHPDQHVRIIGEPMWAGRSDLEYPACAQHEALINLAFAGRAVTILCPYDATRLAPRVLCDAEATHPVLVDADGSRASPGFDPARVIDRYNVPPPRPQPARTRLASIRIDAATMRRGRAVIAEHALAAGLDGQRLADVQLVVTELLANSIDHGGGSGTLRLWTDSGDLVYEVRDRGHLTEPLAGRQPAPTDQVRGRGLLLVNHLADLVRLHTNAGGTTVQVRFRLSDR